MSTSQQQYFDRELSWLSFNQRVLQEAQDKTVPLIERLRFLGIYSSNIDEFYQVRVASVRRVAFLSQFQKKDKAKQLFLEIQEKVQQLQNEFDQTYQELLLLLSDHDIDLINEKQLNEYQQQWLTEYFQSELSSHVFPLMITDKINLTEQIKNDCTYLMVEMRTAEEDLKDHYALVEVPSDVPRFVELPVDQNSKQKNIILIDNIIRHSLQSVFSVFYDFSHTRAFSIKLTRDAEFEVHGEINQSLLESMSSGLRSRLNAEPVRLLYDRKMPEAMVEVLKKGLKIKSNKRLNESGRYLSFKDFIQFPSIGSKDLRYKKLPALPHIVLDNYRNITQAIKEQDILLYYPYHKFSYFTEWLRQSAFDPQVVSIEICLYRVAKRSAVIEALIEAVKNGKHVHVNIELQARFDEEANIEWAEKLSNAGVHVTYGVSNLKVHAKLCVVTREEEGEIIRYAHVGSGNFNESNAQIYTDFSLFTSDLDICTESAQVFEFIKSPYLQFKYKHLIVSPTHTRDKVIELIDKEIKYAKQGYPSEIILKLNNLVDDIFIEQLYRASKAGVKVTLIVRGICALVTGVSGQSENITAVSIVDRYLEHARVSIFSNGGKQRVYISSADWMTRNIERRIEVGCPIYCPKVQKTIIDIINIQLADNCKARILNTDQSNEYLTPKKGDEPLRSQMVIYDYLQKINKEEAKALK
ncbi:polyphosphate kinase 1 [Psychromonas sp. 14N.309.X.WAT.B.A12]|jgi:polyphosphate kinase|uniref:polyphosphate kinase 1 n=1 Tax=unclassified Psychromonas TaxID=2614957 RepID=UPI0025B1B5A4|nr:polyphosphate kinase 1 [Psychromonas sp. 14N.309.X.WAT.B.A12]MDN2662496.1 polyphosphate kinase 1 [Psychromonas sp. 14N.309.X.WAT.B.A12]